MDSSDVEICAPGLHRQFCSAVRSSPFDYLWSVLGNEHLDFVGVFCCCCLGWLGFFWRRFLFPCFRCWSAYTAYHSIHNYIFLSLTSLTPKAFFFFFFFAKYLLMWQNQVRQKPRKALKDTFVKAQQDYIPQKRSQSVLALSKKHLAGPTEKVSRCRVFSQPVCSCRATQQTLMSW